MPNSSPRKPTHQPLLPTARTSLIGHLQRVQRRRRNRSKTQRGKPLPFNGLPSPPQASLTKFGGVIRSLLPPAENKNFDPESQGSLIEWFPHGLFYWNPKPAGLFQEEWFYQEVVCGGFAHNRRSFSQELTVLWWAYPCWGSTQNLWRT